jgi:hypothetical protein
MTVKGRRLEGLLQCIKLGAKGLTSRAHTDTVIKGGAANLEARQLDIRTKLRCSFRGDFCLEWLKGWEGNTL